MIFQIAWRNLWRNPRRTIVILIAVLIGVWSMLFMGAWVRGMMDQMVKNSIATLTGDIQIHRRGYRNDPTIQNSIEDPRNIRDVMKNVLPAGAHWASRIRVNAVANNARHAAGITLVGINPAEEAAVSFISEAVSTGRFLNTRDTNGIIVGKALADAFETRLGRKLVLMSQSTDKNIASSAFRIVGLFHAEMEATEKQFVFITLPAAQKMLKLQPGISEISIVLPDRSRVDATADTLSSELSTDYEVDTWETLLPVIRAYLSMMDEWLFIWYLVVFIAMGFGIVNTMLMAIFERIREFGLLKALGMKPGRIVRSVLMESLLILLLGIATGNILGCGTVYTLSDIGIDLSSFAEGAQFAGISRIIYPALHIRDVVMANLVVFLLGMAVCTYPAVKAARVTPVEAFAHT